MDIIHYLVVDKGMPLSGEKELNMLRVIHILDKVLRMIPSTSVSRSGEFNETTTTIGVVSAINSVAVSSPRSQPPPTPPAATPATPPTPTSNQQTETTPSRRGSWRDDEDYNGAFEVHDSRPPPRDSDSDGSVADAVRPIFCCCLVAPCWTYTPRLAVHYLLCQHHRLRRHTVWSPNMLYAMQSQYIEVPGLRCRLFVHSGLQTINKTRRESNCFYSNALENPGRKIGSCSCCLFIRLISLRTFSHLFSKLAVSV